MFGMIKYLEFMSGSKSLEDCSQNDPASEVCVSSCQQVAYLWYEEDFNRKHGTDRSTAFHQYRYYGVLQELNYVRRCTTLPEMCFCSQSPERTVKAYRLD